MKELDDFTVAELELIASCPLESDRVKSLARIALAAKTAEPVAWWTGPEPTLTGEHESIHDHETGGHYLPLISISTTSEAALSREAFIFKVANFLCTRRQSIAREAETALMIYDMVNTQVTERQKTSIRDGISELRSHIESLGGYNHDAVSTERATPTLNSPELPDGWKLMPIAPTPEMEKAISDGIYNDLYTTGIYADLLAAAPEPPTTEK